MEENNIKGEFLLFAPVRNETGEIFYTLFLEIKKMAENLIGNKLKMK